MTPSGETPSIAVRLQSAANPGPPTEAALRAPPGLSQQVIAGVHEGIIVYGPDLRYQVWNPFMEALTGRSAAEVLGKHPLELFPFLQDGGVIDALQRALRGEVSAALEFRARLPTGERWVIHNNAPLRDEQGQIIGVVATLQDVTERRSIEEGRQNALARVTDVLESTGDAVICMDFDLHVTYFNAAAERVLGRPRHDVLGRYLFDAFPEARGSVFDEKYHEAVRTKQALAFEVYFDIPPYANWYEVRVFPNADGISVFFQVTTERKRAEARIHNSEKKFRALFDNAPIGLLRARADGSEALDVNAAFLRLTGFSREEVIGRPSLGFWADLADRDQIIRIVREQGRVDEFEGRLKTKSGEERHCLLSVQVDHEEGVILGSVIDITERKRADEELARIFELTPALLCTARPDGYFEKVNPEWTRSLGYSQEEVLAAGYVALIHPDDIEATRAEVAHQLVGSRTAQFVNRYRHKDGTYRWLEWTATPAHEGRLYGCARDITEQRRADEEKARLEAQLHHAQKMEAIGTLAGGVAHDFNNILGGVLSGLSLLDLRIGSAQSDLHDDIQDMKDLVRRGADLASQLLGFSRRGKFTAQPLDLTQAVSKIGSMFGRTRRDITVVHDFAPDLAFVVMDFAQLEQALLNLLLNAGDAMPGGGRVWLRAENAALGSEEAARYGLTAGAFVRLIVADSGVGMDEATRARLFEPFFTTKAMGRGTGLGLASVYGIVKNHGGAITVESTPSEGTTFTLLLPATDQRPAAPVTAPATTCGGRGTILVVDDEEALLRLNGRLLTTIGYDVLCAASGREALAMLQQHRARIDVVILDLTMPEMSGAQTFDVIRASWPDLKVLITSGFSDDGQVQALLERGAAGFVKKPFELGELAERLAAVKA